MWVSFHFLFFLISSLFSHSGLIELKPTNISFDNKKLNYKEYVEQATIGLAVISRSVDQWWMDR